MAMASSMASLNPTSLCSCSCSSSSSSSPAPRIIPSKQIPYPGSSLNLNQPGLRPFPSSGFCNAHSLRIPSLVLKASRSGNGEAEYEVYEVEIVKPYGLKFAKGRDGGTYIDAIEPGGLADKTGKFTVGDRVIATSAVFGDDIWPSAEYGRTMYTIRQRMGPLFMKMEKRYGKMDSTGEPSDKEIIRQERSAGFITDRVREIQLKNAMLKKEQKDRREMDLREGLQMYKSGKYEEALEKFESVLGSKPDLNEAAVANYNAACCYSQLNQVEAGLSALEDAMKAGFEDYKRVRRDPDLANLRSSPSFEPMVKKYDESFINEGAINALKSLFGFNKK